jgi:hypothetical protein
VLSFSRRQQGSLMRDASDFGAPLLDRLIVVKRFGAIYLDVNEREACMADALKRYYRCLGAQWLRERFGPSNPAFWNYHRKGLASIGEHVRHDLLAAGIAAGLAKGVLSPTRWLRYAQATVAGSVRGPRKPG